MTSHILTTEYNEYDQHGEYFVAWFHKKPSPDELLQTLIREMKTGSYELCRHLLDTGGGRRMKCREDKYQWFYLREISSANDQAQAPSGAEQNQHPQLPIKDTQQAGCTAIPSFTEEQGYDYATTETDAFMLLLADSEIDLSLVEAKMKDMECERDYARAIARQACELLAENNLKVEYPPMPWDEDPSENNKAPELLTTLKGLWKTRCCACGRECENGCGSTECCGAVQEVIRLEDAAACSSDLHLEWTLLFDTHDGRCHPTRINFRTPGTEADARRYGEHILLQHDRWLKRISQCYPTNPN